MDNGGGGSRGVTRNPSSESMGSCGGRAPANEPSEMFPRYNIALAPAKPFLMPSFNDGDVVEILPSEKANRKINWDENILVQEIENRFAFMYPAEDEDEDSYEIEIVDDDGDADFYLEIVDGEVFYVFETEDDISVGSDDGSYDDEDDSMDEDQEQDPRTPEEREKEKLQQLHAAIPALNLADDDDDKVFPVRDQFKKHQELIDEDTKPKMPSREPSIQAIPSEDNSSPSKEQPMQVDSKPTDKPASKVNELTRRWQAGAQSTPAPPAPTPQKVTTPPPPLPEEAPVASSKPERAQSFDIDNDEDDMELTPTSAPKQKLVDLVPKQYSPVASPIAPASPGAAHRANVKSILKACPESPKKPTQRKKRPQAKIGKDGKREKTFTKTYVRADHYDGEHRVYSWEKPDWTNKQLKRTGMGDAVRQGQNLANPITFPVKKPANAELEEEEDQEVGVPIEGEEGMEKVNRDELIRRIKAGTLAVPMAPLPGYKKNQRHLKFSIKGAMIRDGGDIVQPITKATVLRKSDNINHVANPDVLRTTAVGAKVKEGKNLAGPITKATVLRKPDDVNKLANPNVLKRKGVKPVEKKYEWEKPAWAQARLRKGSSYEDLSTHGSGGPPDGPVSGLSAGPGGLSSGSSHDLMSGSSHSVKKYEWEKPSWVKKRLQPTGKGDVVKKGEDLAKPITDFPSIVRQQQEDKDDDNEDDDEFANDDNEAGNDDNNNNNDSSSNGKGKEEEAAT